MCVSNSELVVFFSFLIAYLYAWIIYLCKFHVKIFLKVLEKSDRNEMGYDLERKYGQR